MHDALALLLLVIPAEAGIYAVEPSARQCTHSESTWAWMTSHSAVEHPACAGMTVESASATEAAT
jgi:hypothetical protein